MEIKSRTVVAVLLLAVSIPILIVRSRRGKSQQYGKDSDVKVDWQARVSKYKDALVQDVSARYRNISKHTGFASTETDASGNKDLVACEGKSAKKNLQSEDIADGQAFCGTANSGFANGEKAFAAHQRECVRTAASGMAKCMTYCTRNAQDENTYPKQAGKDPVEDAGMCGKRGKDVTCTFHFLLLQPITTTGKVEQTLIGTCDSSRTADDLKESIIEQVFTYWQTGLVRDHESTKPKDMKLIPYCQPSSIPDYWLPPGGALKEAKSQPLTDCASSFSSLQQEDHEVPTQTQSNSQPLQGLPQA